MHQLTFVALLQLNHVGRGGNGRDGDEGGDEGDRLEHHFDGLKGESDSKRQENCRMNEGMRGAEMLCD